MFYHNFNLYLKNLNNLIAISKYNLIMISIIHLICVWIRFLPCVWLLGRSYPIRWSDWAAWNAHNLSSIFWWHQTCWRGRELLYLDLCLNLICQNSENQILNMKLLLRCAWFLQHYSDTSGMVNIASDDQIKKAANLIKRIDLKDFSVCQISNPGKPLLDSLPLALSYYLLLDVLRFCF